MHRKTRYATVALISLTIPGAALGQPSLSAVEIAAIETGRQVVHDQPVPGSAWPRVTIHQFIAATPLEAAAVFAEYPRHSSYVPGIRKASVALQVSPLVAEVDYVLEVPLFPDESYTVRDSISASDDGSGYRVDWTMVRARSTKAIAGFARFQPHRNARTGVVGTLLTYENLVVPGQALARPLKGRAVRQVRETVLAIVAETERVRREQPDRLATQARTLAAAIARDP